MAKKCFTFLLLAGLCLSSYAQQKTIAVIGSSTAEGYGLPDVNGDQVLNTGDNSDNDRPVNSWANRLKRYYANLNLLNELDNFAIFGQDIYQAMPHGYVPPGNPGDRRLPDDDNNITAALSVNADIIIINFPSNNYYFIEADEAMDRFHDLYNAATANGHTKCYITTTQPRTNEEYADMTVRAKLLTLKDRIVAEFPNNYIDFWTPVVDDRVELSPGVPNDNYLGIKDGLGQGDGVHLNEAGHEILFNQVLAKNLVPIVPLPLKVGSLHVKRVDDKHITVTFTVLDGNTEKEFFIWVKDKAGNTKSVRVVIPDKTKTTETISETIQIY